MSLARYYMALTAAAAAASLPPSTPTPLFTPNGLVQACDVKFSQLTMSNGLVTGVSDLSGRGNHLVAPAGSSGAQLVTENGTQVLKQMTGGGASSLATDYGQGYNAYTLWMLFEVYQSNGGFMWPWFGSPYPAYQPNPFIYTTGNLQSYFGGGYGAYGPLIGRGLRLAIFAYDSGSGYNRLYHTDYGIGYQEPGNSPITGSCIGNDGLQGLVSTGLYDYAFSVEEMYGLRDRLAPAHQLPNL